MTIDTSPEAVENLCNRIDEWWEYQPGHLFTESATTLRALSAALTASQAETAAAYDIATHYLDKWATNLRDLNFPNTAPIVEQCSAMIRDLTTADIKAALDRMIAEAEERGRNIGVATENLGRRVEWLKEDEYNVLILPADDVEKMRAILAAIPKGKDHE